MRIISLLPSATEMIADLGLADSLVGISHACDYPAEIKHLPRVTSCNVPKDASSIEIDHFVRSELQNQNALYILDIDQIRSLNPDLIISQALCDVCAVDGRDVEKALSNLPEHVQLINFEPFTLDDVLNTLLILGEATAREDLAKNLYEDCQARIQKVRERQHGARPSMVLLDWVDPPFISGHWMRDLIQFAGADSCFDLNEKPSFSCDWDALIQAKPDHLAIACCGFDMKRTLNEILTSNVYFQLDILNSNGTKIHLFDGNQLFSRASLRLVDSLELLAHSLFPKRHPFTLPRGVDIPVGQLPWQK
ncbi:ABC transporter substrate-binding protein [Temperatibacter marinus]|uniref:ABC transporter substrate-binding protein n=1 Tax=Temperatibacter marinus TaxID=1456591 RepID=A0AA52HBT6_9PROT|nr:ABC transporter substrate-binding protein [Temperatibacter marinus]WND03983.1 ABC transporter substrate-binding protein [Temperatibacter marinus]